MGTITENFDGYSDGENPSAADWSGYRTFYVADTGRLRPIVVTNPGDPGGWPAIRRTEAHTNSTQECSVDVEIPTGSLGYTHIFIQGQDIAGFNGYILRLLRAGSSHMDMDLYRVGDNPTLDWQETVRFSASGAVSGTMRLQQNRRQITGTFGAVSLTHTDPAPLSDGYAGLVGFVSYEFPQIQAYFDNWTWTWTPARRHPVNLIVNPDGSVLPNVEADLDNLPSWLTVDDYGRWVSTEPVTDLGDGMILIGTDGANAQPEYLFTLNDGNFPFQFDAGYDDAGLLRTLIGA